MSLVRGAAKCNLLAFRPSTLRQCVGCRPSSDNKGRDDSANASREEGKKFPWIVAGSLSLIGGSLLYYYRDDLSNVFAGPAGRDRSRRTRSKIFSDRYELKANPALKLPKKVPYLLIGSGTASFSAARAIRAHDENAKVLIVGEERYKPYMRPPLSKELWFADDRALVRNFKFKQWNGRERSIFFEHDEYYVQPEQLDSMEHGGISVVSGRRVVQVDVQEHLVHLDNGQTVQYDKCLIATGGYPKVPEAIVKSQLEPDKHYTLFRDADDFLRLDQLCAGSKCIVVVGGGFLGSELACALAKRAQSVGLKVIHTFPENGCMGKVLPGYLSTWATERLKSQGVVVMPGVKVSKASLHGDLVTLLMDNGQTVRADHVVFATGLEPNTQLARSAGLEVDPNNGGFLCDAELRARSDIWVAGDCCSFYDIKLGRRRVEHHDHAVVSGRLAGENMAGNKMQPYWHQSMFWSDLGPEVGYEAIGLVDSALPTVGVFAKGSPEDTPQALVQTTGESIRSDSEAEASHSTITRGASEADQPTCQEDYGKGVVFYLKGKRIVGIVLWNVFNCMPIARRLIMEQSEHENFGEVAKLFNLFGTVEESDT